jgi:hypothetical protein
VHVVVVVVHIDIPHVHKKEIIHTAPNKGIYYTSDKVTTLYTVKYIFENYTDDINAKQQPKPPPKIMGLQPQRPQPLPTST